jgi:nucleotidyltransferase/DNA polymerase involved in DNA repair
MQNQNLNRSASSLSNTRQPTSPGQSQPSYANPNLEATITAATRAAELTRLRQGVMHVRIRHFYCTLEEIDDPTLRGLPFVVGTGTGRPNEPGRIIDASPAAQRLGLSPGMPLRRAYRLAPRARFLPASHERYQAVLQLLKERYRTYSRIVESIPLADAYIDLRGCEQAFTSPVTLAEQLCTELTGMGLTPFIGIANGKAIAELAALLSRKDGRDGVLYVPPGRESSFIQTLPLSLLSQVRALGAGITPMLADLDERDSTGSRPPDSDGKSDHLDTVAVSEAVSHFKDFGITTFAQVSLLNEAGLTRRLGQLGGWIYQLSCGNDTSLVVPDAPPLSQNARIRFHHAASADETCEAIGKLAQYLSERLREQRLRGKMIALVLSLNRPVHGTQKLVIDEDGEVLTTTAAEKTIGGQVTLDHHTDEVEVIAHQILMLFAHYHRSAYSYMQVQVRIGEIVSATPTNYTPPVRPHSKLTRKL